MYRGRDRFTLLLIIFRDISASSKTRLHSARGHYISATVRAVTAFLSVQFSCKYEIKPPEITTVVVSTIKQDGMCVMFYHQYAFPR